MLSNDQNSYITSVGPKTALGRGARRFWIPVLTSADLPAAGGDPVRVTILDEDFVIFRTADGTLGMLDEYCRHRGASLLLGRVEDCGIRCIYHGWKFGADGSVLETPNVADPKFRTRVKARAYSIRQAGGLAWAYLGPPDAEPPFPEWSWFELPASNIIATSHFVHCNFVQVLEGLLDSSHLGILHSNALGVSMDAELTYAQKVGPMQFDKAPKIEVQPTDFGYRYAAIRKRDGREAARITSFVAPFTVVNPNGDVVTIVVPCRDDLTVFFHVFWDESEPLGEEPMRSEHLEFIGLDAESLRRIGASNPNSSFVPSSRNHYHQDRDAMREGKSFSGLPGLIAEDVIVSEASGSIRDRSKEMLSVSDLAVAQLYKSLQSVAKAGEENVAPPGITFNPRTGAARGFDIDDLSNVDWRKVS